MKISDMLRWSKTERKGSSQSWKEDHLW